MQSNNNPNKHVSWCNKQKRGIKLEPKNENLCNAYLHKANSALNILTAAIEKEEVDWIATTAYYARYFAFYALLQKCGISSEIHDCTILISNLLEEESILPKGTFQKLEDDKKLRIDNQYYLKNRPVNFNPSDISEFILKIKSAVNSLTLEKIKKIREKVSKS